MLTFGAVNTPFIEPPRHLGVPSGRGNRPGREAVPTLLRPELVQHLNDGEVTMPSSSYHCL